jgi:hypothetical protein
MSGKRRSKQHIGGYGSRAHALVDGSQRTLVAILVLSLVGLGAVLSYHYGTAAAGSNPALANLTAPPASTRTSASSTPTRTPKPRPTATNTAGLAAASSVDPRYVSALHVAYPKSGPRTFRYASTTGPVLGRSGPIRRFRVAIESNITMVAMRDFTAKINAALGDARSWIAAGHYRLQQVGSASSSEFTIYLVTPATATRMCLPLRVHGFTSCRQGPHVVLNLARFLTSVSGYTKADVPLDTYRTYMINHEVGHALGHGHELCPGPGKPAPVMEQQTYGLHGCRANPWPFVKGKRYDGPSGQY